MYARKINTDNSNLWHKVEKIRANIYVIILITSGRGHMPSGYHSRDFSPFTSSRWLLAM
jgi:hypothetical protein